MISVDEAVALGYDKLREEHLKFWRDYFSASSIDIPSEEFQYFYDANTNGLANGIITTGSKTSAHGARISNAIPT